MAIDLSEWMKKIRDEKSLSELSVPGTHDSCARYGGGDYECQTWDLQTQLENGIRFFDIRCRHYQDTFTIHHAEWYQHLDFPDVRDVCVAFLQAHPSETIIMSVKEEYNAADNQLTFQQVFDRYRLGVEGFWWLGNVIPTLGEARGKIVLFRRFDCPGLVGTRGLDVHTWAKDQTFDILNDGNHIRVQDGYSAPTVFKHDVSAKWTRISVLLDEAQTGPSYYMYVNFTSASGGGFPSTYATGLFSINDRLRDYLSGQVKKRCGIVVMDFPESPGNELCKLIIGMNEFDKISLLTAAALWLRNLVQKITKIFPK